MNKNFSADMIRVGEYLYRGNARLANKFLQICETKYRIDDRWNKLFFLAKQGSADAALTLGRLMVR